MSAKALATRRRFGFSKSSKFDDVSSLPRSNASPLPSIEVPARSDYGKGANDRESAGVDRPDPAFQIVGFRRSLFLSLPSHTHSPPLSSYSAIRLREGRERTRQRRRFLAPSSRTPFFCILGAVCSIRSTTIDFILLSILNVPRKRTKIEKLSAEGRC